MPDRTEADLLAALDAAGLAHPDAATRAGLLAPLAALDAMRARVRTPPPAPAEEPATVFAPQPAAGPRA